MIRTPVKPGTKWGQLTVIKAVEKNEASHVLWEVKCECGTKTRAWGYSLVKGTKISCGCVRRRNGEVVPVPKLVPKEPDPVEEEIAEIASYICGELDKNPDKIVRAFTNALEKLGESELAVTVKRKWKLLSA
jgi:hypothetical protein